METSNAPGESAGESQGELTCQELVELVTSYREGTLPPEQRRRFDAHLAVCPPCVRYVEQLDVTIRALGGLNEQVEQAPDTQRLLSLFSQWKQDSTG